GQRRDAPPARRAGRARLQDLPRLRPPGPLRPVLVTGAAGFIGSHLVDALLARDIPVRALVRPETERTWLDASRVSFVSGSLDDKDSLAQGADGCEAVYHVAGITQARLPGDFQRVNADGCGRMG